MNNPYTPLPEHLAETWTEVGGFIVGPDGQYVCDPRCLPPTPDNIAVMDRNAKLIAAAPAMLASIRHFLRMMGDDNCNDMGDILDSACCQFRKATKTLFLKGNHDESSRNLQ